MSVIISPNLVIPASDFNLNGNSPIIGYQNAVSDAVLSATTEDPDFPASNLANPYTHLRWKAGAGSPSTEEYITAIFDAPTDIDYVGIAKHNFGSSVATISIEVTPEEPQSPTDWNEVISERILSTDRPAIFRFTKQPVFGVRIRIQESQSVPIVSPFLGVFYAGELLLLQRRIYVGHTPITLGRETKFQNQRSIAGDFIGRIIQNETARTSVEMQNLTPDWYRTYFDPFVLAAQTAPFFFAWRPSDYPDESGFCWLAEDPTPSNQRPNGMMQVSLELEGIVK